MTAWKPVLMLATEQREWQVSHCRKYNLVSFCRMVSGERHVWQVTYSSAGKNGQLTQQQLLLHSCLEKLFKHSHQPRGAGSENLKITPG